MLNEAAAAPLPHPIPLTMQSATALLTSGVACVCVVGAARSLEFPAVNNPPAWDWSTLGKMAFVHSGQAKAYAVADLALLSRFPIVQFDKKENIQAMPGVAAEDRLIAAARQVRTSRHLIHSP